MDRDNSGMTSSSELLSLNVSMWNVREISNWPILGYVPMRGWTGVGWYDWQPLQSHMVVGSSLKELAANMKRKGEGMLGTRDHRWQPGGSEVAQGGGAGRSEG